MKVKLHRIKLATMIVCLNDAVSRAMTLVCHRNLSSNLPETQHLHGRVRASKITMPPLPRKEVQTKIKFTHCDLMWGGGVERDQIERCTARAASAPPIIQDIRVGHRQIFGTEWTASTERTRFRSETSRSDPAAPGPREGNCRRLRSLTVQSRVGRRSGIVEVQRRRDITPSLRPGQGRSAAETVGGLVARRSNKKDPVMELK